MTGREFFTCIGFALTAALMAIIGLNGPALCCALMVLLFCADAIVSAIREQRP